LQPDSIIRAVVSAAPYPALNPSRYRGGFVPVGKTAVGTHQLAASRSAPGPAVAFM